MSVVPVSVVEGALKSCFMSVAESSTRPYYSEPYEVSAASWSGKEIRGSAARSYRLSSGVDVNALCQEVAMNAVHVIVDDTVIDAYRHSLFSTKAVSKRWDSKVFLIAAAGVRELDAGSSTTENVKLQAELLVSTMKTFLHAASRRKALDYMYEVLENAYSNSNFGLINEMLFCASKSLIGESLAVSFLRATSRAKYRSVYWSYYCGLVKESYEGNPDAERILRGLA